MTGLIVCSSAALSTAVPADLLRQIPQGYRLLSFASATITRPRQVYFVALASRKKVTAHLSETRAPARPLLIFECRTPSRCALIARNDNVILRADEGGINGCDPFLDFGRKIVVKGLYFTVEQGVACGAHWTDYVTFRFDRHSNSYMFDNWRTQTWHLNNDSDAEALVSDGQKVLRAKGRIPFEKWRRPPI